jgi:glycosyltransferase involved in cell wall biosynthesis
MILPVELQNCLKGVRVLAALNGLELFGHERENLSVLAKLKAMGAEVKLCVNAIGKGGEVGRQAKEMGFDIDYLPFGNQWSWLWLIRDPKSQLRKPEQVLRCSLKFGSILRNFKPTHVHLGSSLAYSFLMPALRFWTGPLIYRIGDHPPVDSLFNLPIWRSAMRRATKVVAISEFIRGAVKKQCGEAIGNKTTLIYGSKVVDPVHHRGTLGRIGFVGQIHEQKGVFHLLGAFQALLETHPTAVLEYVGRGPAEDELRRRIERAGLENRVRLHGYLEHPEEVVKDWSFQVVPSIWDEALGIVVLEAKALGKPAVVFPRGGLPEMIQHQIDGYVCRDTTVEALTEALEWMFLKGEGVEDLGAEARKDAVHRFGMDRFQEGWKTVYLETMPASVS